jgi:hypothetical protein
MDLEKGDSFQDRKRKCLEVCWYQLVIKVQQMFHHCSTGNLVGVLKCFDGTLDAKDIDDFRDSRRSVSILYAAATWLWDEEKEKKSRRHNAAKIVWKLWSIGVSIQGAQTVNQHSSPLHGTSTPTLLNMRKGLFGTTTWKWCWFYFIVVLM